MSVEASGWAFRQVLPPKAKIVLLALADQTDETTGRVCYGKTDMKHLARKSSVGERSIYRYIAALTLNGYVIKQSGKTKGQASEYWLCLDRTRSASLKDWKWLEKAAEPTDTPADDAGDETTDDAPDVEDGSAILADPPDGENDDPDAQIGRGGLPQDGRQGVSCSTSNITEKASLERESSFSRKAQDVEIENRAIKAAAEKENARTFVYENSDAWRSWCAYRRARGQIASFPTCTHVVDGQYRRGWWLPSLYPPKGDPGSTTGPPSAHA